MRRTDGVEQCADGENLADRADEILVVAAVIEEDFVFVGVDDPQAPGGAFVERFVEDGLDRRWDLGWVFAGDRGARDACGANGEQQQGCGSTAAKVLSGHD
jgi:hypothetical protein